MPNSVFILPHTTNILLGFFVLMSAVNSCFTLSQQPKTDLDQIYADESHCLTGPEIRKTADNPKSCYCRDALVDIRYIYQNYVENGKDMNLKGAVLSLETRAREVCGENYDVLTPETDHWQWAGPEVVRIYPSDAEIEQIKPDAKGFRRVQYKVRVTYRDSGRNVTRIETFAAWYLDGPSFNGRRPKP